MEKYMEPVIIYLDFETYSPTSIDAGVIKYTRDPEADIVLMAYCIEKEGERDETKIWVPNTPLPKEFYKAPIIYAHNAPFDYEVWHAIGRERYGLPVIPLAQWRCSMALAYRYTLPGALAEAAKVLKLEHQKQEYGSTLIKKISTPTSYGQRPAMGRDFTSTDFTMYCQYAREDVNTMMDLIDSLPSSKLSDHEQSLWEMTHWMNRAGLPMDSEAHPRILGYIEGYVEEMTRLLPQVTGGLVEKATQAKRIVEWCASQGVKLPNLQGPTVTAALRRDDLPDNVRQVLELREALGRSSTGKYQTMALMEHKGHVHGSLQYYGTQKTGRWSGRGLQIHNLPRASVTNPEAVIHRFMNFEPVDEPVKKAMALIRPMVCAKPNSKLIVADYSSIENRLLVWHAGDDRALKIFVDGGDQYRDMASGLYRKKPEDITKDERLMGKILVLGCGYQMGAPRFVESAADWGVKLRLPEAKVAVDGYRAHYPLVVKMWANYTKAAKQAIMSPGESITANKVGFQVVKDRKGNKWLSIKLASGRCLYYAQPFLGEGKYGSTIYHFGIHPKTKQWVHLEISPGRLTENIMQATARDVMAQGLLNIQRDMPEISLRASVHDEAIGVVNVEDIYDTTLADFERCMCTMPPWAKGLPLEAEGYIERRYRK